MNILASIEYFTPAWPQSIAERETLLIIALDLYCMKTSGSQMFLLMALFWKLIYNHGTLVNKKITNILDDQEIVLKYVLSDD